MCPNLDIVVPKLLEERSWAAPAGGGAALPDLGLGGVLRVGMPLSPMLAKMQSSYGAMLETFKGRAFLAEHKYDGMRAQVHVVLGAAGGRREVRIFSRNSEDITDRFSDVAEAILESTPAGKDAIFDGEVCAVDRSKAPAQLLPFQSLARRPKGPTGRSATGERAAEVCVYLFDCLYHGGESMVKAPYRARREFLRSAAALSPRPGFVEYAEGDVIEGDGAEEAVEAAMLRSIERGCEGLMCKLLDGPASAYEPSKRSDSWVKLKKDYIDGIADSLDLVPIGAWYGNGRKAGWYSPVLLAAYDPETDTFQSVCRVMSGFTDEMYTKLTLFYAGKVLAGKQKKRRKPEAAEGAGSGDSGDKGEPTGRLLPRKPPNYITNESCRVWFDACEVWTIRGAEFSLSPTHMCAQGRIACAAGRGLALRFPRFLHERPDKTTAEATTPAQILELYTKQHGAEKPAAAAGYDDDDDDIL
uniref:DNA ligase n=1 Tax=Phaeomonas parva TaxID=124430 RepID=A0A7S1XVB2_9STRA